MNHYYRNNTKRLKNATGFKHSIKFICILILIFLGSKLTAQEEFVPPPAKIITSFPFTQLTGGIIIIHGTLDSLQDTLNFVLDTGSGGISLDSATCAYYNLKLEPSDRIVRGIAGMKYVSFAKDHSLNLPGLTVKSLDFHINDYEILSSAYGMHIDGIVGYSFFRRYIVNIDYDEQLVRIFTVGTYKYPRGGHLLKPQFSTLPMQMASVKDANKVFAKFYLDTGAGLCLLMNDDFAKDSVIFKKKRKMFLSQAEGLGGKTDMMLSVVKEVKIGPYRFRKVPAYIFSDDYNVTNYPVLGGLLGNDLLRRFNMWINYPLQEIYIKPNKHYLDSFDYSYTGLGIYLINGAITVTDIIKSSPAETAGFQSGDIIVGVESNFSNNIQAYKILLQNARTKLRIVVMRKGQPQIIYLKVKSIL
ncbi:aspartyl protease family protein [Parafilimonas sp.]|uniref:retropepsin-like aspartic protease n=1 Tax=Parafilimonas sp. TaxID=1969739 RepID=UPI003F7E9933